MWVGDHGPVHADVIVIIEIQESFFGELSTIVGNDRVKDPEVKMMSWMKSMACLVPILARGFASIHLVNLSITMSKWVKPSGAFLKGPGRSKPHTVKVQVMGIIWSHWAGA
jgi:hypothetical protein